MTDTVSDNDNDLDQAVRWHDEALLLSESGEFVAAGERLDRALKLFENLAGSEHPDVANVLNARGLIAEKLGDAQVARAAFERAVQITRPELSVTQPDGDIARIHVQAILNLGSLERSAGNYELAGPLLEQALSLAQHWLSADDLDTSNALNALGMWCKFTGRFERGREVYQQALAILRRNFGDDDSRPEIACLYHNLGGLEHSAGEFIAGEQFARKSVVIRSRAVGTAHPDYAADIGGLAALVADQGRADEAESLYREALAIFERVHGDDHYEIAVLLHNLAAVEVARERLDSAWDLYHRAAAMKERWLGADHPDLALTLHNLAILALDMDRSAAAATFCRQALTIFEHNLVETHPTLLTCRACWAEIEARSK